MDTLVLVMDTPVVDIRGLDFRERPIRCPLCLSPDQASEEDFGLAEVAEDEGAGSTVGVGKKEGGLDEEVRDMPFGMGPLGWFMFPYGYPYPGIGDYGAPYANPYYGTGLGSYYGMGYAPQVPPEQELQMLRDNSKALKEELERINQRISELEKQEKK